MAVKIKNKRGKNIILLNPFEKGNKMFCELRDGVHYTNDCKVKLDKHGKPRKLNDTQKAFRSGYLAAQKDARRVFRAKHPNYKPKAI